jgi:streptomycin 6-kinase
MDIAPLLNRFVVTQTDVCIETPIAYIHKVLRHDGTPAALKTYKNGNMQDEAPGFALLTAWDGEGAALIYDQTEMAVLLEWLDGPSLGDMVRGGDDIAATAILGDVAAQLHATTPALTTNLPRLEDEFATLLRASFTTDCPAQTKHAVQTAQTLATSFLATQTDLRPLHRDLHHDNIKGSARGYLAFDAKGVIGERTYELANAFRNPIGAEALYSDPQTIMRRLGVWSQTFDVPPQRLLECAAIHSALSLAWTYNGTFGPDAAKEAILIDTFLALMPD